jgi:hypothetical protein
MRSFILPFVLLCLHTSHAQTILCDTLPIFYDPVSITFTTADQAFGDSVIVFELTNTSTVNMAYPQAKLIPLTPLPPGMVQNTEWDTYASSWNTGVTMPANCFFEVTQPIPVNYTVTFEVWARNLTPLLVDDSCVFDGPFTVNLNPAGNGIIQRVNERAFRVWPSPAADRLHVAWPEGSSGARVVLINASGAEVRTIKGSDTEVDVTGLDAGVYAMMLMSNGRTIAHQRVVITH